MYDELTNVYNASLTNPNIEYSFDLSLDEVRYFMGEVVAVQDSANPGKISFTGKPQSKVYKLQQLVSNPVVKLCCIAGKWSLRVATGNTSGIRYAYSDLEKVRKMLPTLGQSLDKFINDCRS